MRLALPTRSELSAPGLLFALAGAAGLWLPLVQLKPNRIVPGTGLELVAALPGAPGWALALALVLPLLIGLDARRGLILRLSLALAGLCLSLLALGLAADALMPAGNRMARVSPAAGFWLLLLAFGLMATDALARLRPSLKLRAALLLGAVIAVAGLLGSGWLDHTSVMIEYAARAEMFSRSLWQHLLLSFGSLAMAFVVGLPTGIAIFMLAPLRKPVLGLLNMLQTIPSLALFGIMIPLFGWIATHVPGAAELGVAGIGPFPALMALFLYALLPVVSNTWVGLSAVSPAVRDAALGIGMTPAQVLARVELPLALPVVLAAVRIVLVQNIGLAVIAGLIGGGGFGSFVFQGLNQTAMDLILLGALPTIFLALVAGIGLDLIVEALSRRDPERSTP
ncbi:ABC transporter permease [Rhodobacter lacus]|uniref:ABC transporter permease n=1 Tax=Rhodobacter lacus TaxID=1641972 RepID=A0ABW5A341_9RHOB